MFTMPRSRYLWPQSTAAPLVIWLISAVIFYSFFQMGLHYQAPPSPTSSGIDAILFILFPIYIYIIIIRSFNVLWVMDRSFVILWNSLLIFSMPSVFGMMQDWIFKRNMLLNLSGSVLVNFCWRILFGVEEMLRFDHVGNAIELILEFRWNEVI